MKEFKIEDLKKEIPYKWRVQSYSKNKPSAQCVAYIDARDVQDLLDRVVGAENWQSDYKAVGDKLFAGIGINIGGEWVWKWDTGSESQMEAEKGHASDAFKRAGVKWGIGRFLYSLDIQYVPTNSRLIIENGKSNYPYVVDEAGQRVWDLTTYINNRNK
jgi:hypothetical protein